MGTFKMMSRVELRTRKKLAPEDVALFDQFKGYLSRINGDDVVIYEYSKDDNRERCRKLLRRAAKALDVPVRIVEDGDSLIFYRRAVRNPRQATDQPRRRIQI